MMYYLILIFSLLFTGCLPSTHHLYSGEILKSGQEETSYGYTPKHYLYKQISTKSLASVGPMNCQKGEKCTLIWDNSFLSISKSWRIGAVDSVWIFPGLEYGFTLEIPFSWGFGVRLGMPSATPYFKHAVGLGWDLGTYLDNSIWAEYTTSLHPAQYITLSLNNRVNLMASQFEDMGTFNQVVENGAGVLGTPHRTFKWQSLFLLHWNTQSETWILPDKVHTGISNQWFALPEYTSHSASYLNLDEPNVFLPTIVLGLTWN